MELARESSTMSSATLWEKVSGTRLEASLHSVLEESKPTSAPLNVTEVVEIEKVSWLWTHVLRVMVPLPSPFTQTCRAGEK